MIIKTPYGNYENVEMTKGKYMNGNLAIQLWNDEGQVATLTVNLSQKLPAGYAYVDTNNCPWAEEFIKEYGLGKATGLYESSGWCTYPLYDFRESEA